MDFSFFSSMSRIIAAGFFASFAIRPAINVLLSSVSPFHAPALSLSRISLK
jgi:hypothetical protein